MKNFMEPGPYSPGVYKLCGFLMKVLAIFTAVVIGLPCLLAEMFFVSLVAFLAAFGVWKLGQTWASWGKTPAEDEGAPKNETSPTTQEPAQVSATPQTIPEPNKIERHKVAGISFRADAVESLGVENSDYDLTKREMIENCLTGERVYRTDYYVSKVELIPEPENPHDPRAIRVETDGVHIGYIKSGSCAHIHKLLNDDKIASVKCEIRGGRYKILLEDYDEDGNEVYELDKDDVPLHAVLYIEIK